MNRRRFLQLAPALILTLSCASRTGEKSQGLLRTDPKCPPEAYRKLIEHFRKNLKTVSPQNREQRLRDGRNWLAGKEIEPGPGESASWVELPVPGATPVRARVLRPSGPCRGAILAIHGGGWIMGSALSDEKRNWELARTTRAAVVSPDYRLAPEHPYPAAADDCEAAARWLVEVSGREFGGQALGLIGSSAGAHLGACTLLRLEPEVRDRFKGAVLFYGVYDLGRSEVWRNSTAEDYPDLTPEDMTWFVNLFLPGLDDQARRAPRYSPLFADLRGLPPALFLVGGADILADDTRRMARRWADQGNSAELVEYPGAPHGFDFFDDMDCGLKPQPYAAAFLARCLDGQT